MQGDQASIRADRWISFAVFAGGGDRLDSALEQVVAPAIRQAGDEAGEPACWFFERYVDDRGPHLRVHVAAPSWSEDERARLARHLGRGLDDLDVDRVRDPILPRPRSQREGDHRVGVEPAELRLGLRSLGGPPGLALAAPLFQVSSEVVVAVLADLPRGRERLAYGLLLMAALSELGVEAGERPAFWRGVARACVGEDARGRRLLDRLARDADRLAPEIAATARKLRDDVAAGAGLRRYAQACREMLRDAAELEGIALGDLVRRHAHLTCNRLGVTPLEESLLASLLAAGALDRTEQGAAPSLGDGAAEGGAEGGSSRGGEALRVREVTKRHDEETALDDISFEVREGEIFGLLGPEGAGKSSLLGVAAGLRVPSSGSVRALGLDPRNDRVQLADDLGMPPPESELADQATARETLELHARAADGGDSPDSVLATIGLSDRAGTRVADLDRGERRLLRIGCALLADPRLLFLDEPTAGLSPLEREAVWDLLAAQPGAGRTVVLTTSAVQEARSLCHRVGIVVAGSLVAVGEPEELVEDYFPERSVRFETEVEPDRALLEDLPEALSVKVTQHPGHWSVEVVTIQPDELMKLIGNDPAFPRVVRLRAEDIENAFPSPRN